MSGHRLGRWPSRFPGGREYPRETGSLQRPQAGLCAPIGAGKRPGRHFQPLPVLMVSKLDTVSICCATVSAPQEALPPPEAPLAWPRGSLSPAGVPAGPHVWRRSAPDTGPSGRPDWPPWWLWPGRGIYPCFHLLSYRSPGRT